MTLRSNDIWRWEAVQIAKAVAKREISAREAVEDLCLAAAAAIEARAGVLTPIDPRA